MDCRRDMIAGFSKEEKKEFTEFNLMAFEQAVKEAKCEGKTLNSWLKMTDLERESAIDNFKASMVKDGRQVENNVDLLLLLKKLGIENAINLLLDRWKEKEKNLKEMRLIVEPVSSRKQQRWENEIQRLIYWADCGEL